MKVRIRPLEWWALGIAIALFVTGFTLGYLGESVWLNRFGSLIIVVGVLAATVKISDILTLQIDKFMNENHQKLLDEVVQNNRTFFEGTLPPGYQDRLEKEVTKKVYEKFAEYKKNQIDRAKLVEINVIVFGTLTNGFGDYLLSFFKVVAT
jgi:2-hydroxy-3-keto-5-methylthiopentenyl-1-phosphate phosphatase